MSTATHASDLVKKHCSACEGGVIPLPESEIHQTLQDLPGWELAGQEIAKTYHFKNYFETLAFVNATAWISHREDHHPDLEVAYSHCKVRYSTHAVGGITENDLICAAKIEELVTHA